MWDGLVRAPRGSYNLRKFSRVLATFLVACFGYILTSSPTAFAADASWEGSNLSYNSNTHEPVTADPSFPDEIKSSPAIYQYIDDSKNPTEVHFIYFTATTQVPQSEKEASYIKYTLNPPNSFANASGKKTISLTPIEASDVEDTTDGAIVGTCTIDGIGWIVCPIMNGIAEGMDFIYAAIRSFLVVQPITTSVDNPIYRIWVYSRDLANIMFAIGFVIIIYSYLVGGGFNGYEIRKIIPRLAVAAVLINVSYILCALAVDISNIAGYGVNALFESVRDEVLPGSATSASVNWVSVTTWVLAGGTGAAVAALTLPAAIGGAAGGLWFMLAPFLLGGALLVLVTFIILAARQAIIVIAIAISPLAFAAFILPNTEKWFERWRGLFFTMLIMFPAFGAVFGGAQLAGEVIIRTATSIEQIILGLGVMIAPLAVTPLLLKLGGGVLNRVGGMINNQQRGVYDRYKNYNKDRLAEHVAKNNARNAEMLAAGTLGRRQFVRRRAARDFAKRNYREEQKKQDEERAVNAWHRQTGRYGYDNNGARDSQRTWYGTRANGYGNLDTYKRDNQLQHNLTNAEHEEHWQHLLDHDAARRGILTNTRLAEGRSKVLSGAMEAQDERTFQTALNTDAAYANLRDMKIQTAVDSGVADLQKGVVEAAGQQEFRRTVEASKALSRVVKDTHHAKKQAELYENIVQNAAEKSWNDRIRNDADTQTLYLQSKRNEGGAQYAEQQVKTFVQNVRSKGSDAPNVTAAAVAYADQIKDLVLETDTAKNAEAAAQSKERTNLATAYKASAALRMKAGGIGGEAAANLVFAKAFQTMVNDQVEGTKAEKTILSQTDSDEIFRRMDNPDASVEQLAAYAGTIASRGYHAHHLKLLGKASRMYQAAVASGDDEQVAKMRDMIQQIGSDQSKVAFGIRDYDRTLLSEGRYDSNIYTTTKERILTNLSPDVMANMDPDDIHLIYEMHRKGFLSSEESQKIRDEWDAWQKDPNLKSKIQTKHRNFFDRIATDDYTSSIGGMNAPIEDKYGLTAADFGTTPPDVQIRK